MTTEERYFLVRKNGNEHSTRGPFAKLVTWEEADAERTRLAKQYPLQTFVIVAEVTRKPPQPKPPAQANVTPIGRRKASGA